MSRSRRASISSSILTIALALSVWVALPAHAVGVTSITSGSYVLALESPAAGQFGLSVFKGTTRLYTQASPLQLFIRTAAESELSVSRPYSSWSASNGVITAVGSVTTAAGSQFRFTDVYAVEPTVGAFRMSRAVEVLTAQSADTGFSTRFSVIAESTTSIDGYRMFLPGTWYEDATKAPTGSFGRHTTDENFFVKESRLPLPMAMMRHVSSTESASLVHVSPTISSAQAEDSASWLVHPGFQFGSMGVKKSPRMSLVYAYPSSEGDRNYYGNESGALRRLGMVRRSHPVQVGTPHTYSLVMRFGTSGTHAAAQTEAWRHAFGLFSPSVVPIPANTLYANGIAYLSSRFTRSIQSSAAGIRWSSWVHGSGGREYHLQSGFVGQQAKVGWLLLREGYRTSSVDLVTKGSAILDFWATQSKNPSGIPKTDFWMKVAATDPAEHWGEDKLFLRTTSDAAEGVLDGFDTAWERGDYHYDWLTYARAFGDFLVAKQATDGSWSRAYRADGSVVDAAKTSTSNAIRFLVKLHRSTGDPNYRTAALKAGDWVRLNATQTNTYVGGTPDNDNVTDKEAGVMALNGYNALYDLTGDSTWLTAARSAADFVETWMFARSFTVHPSTRWAAGGPGLPAWIQVDLGTAQPITRIETMFEFASAYKYRLQTSMDGTYWTTFSDKTSNTAAPVTRTYADSGAGTGRYVRVTITGTPNGAWPSVFDLRVYNATGVNIAQGKPATASSSQSADRGPGRAVDGVVATAPGSPWPQAGLIGQSLVATGHSYVDTFLINAPAEFYRLSVATGDQHHLQIAQLLANNANAPSDHDGRLGYQHRALIGEGVIAHGFTTYYGEECLTWQTAVQLESIALLEDTFGYRSIDQIQTALTPAQRQAANHFTYTPMGPGPANLVENGKTYRIVNRQTGKLVDVQGASLADGANIWQWQDINGAAQQWVALSQPGGYWKFVSRASQQAGSPRVIDVEGSGTANGVNVSQYHDVAGALNQQWTLTGIGGGYWKVANRNSAKLLDLEGGQVGNGANISQFADVGGRNQQWLFKPVLP